MFMDASWGIECGRAVKRLAGWVFDCLSAATGDGMAADACRVWHLSSAA